MLKLSNYFYFSVISANNSNVLQFKIKFTYIILIFIAFQYFQILFSSVYVIVVYYLTSQPMEPKRMAMFVFICILTSLVAQSLGLLIGAGLSVEAGVFLGPVSTIPTILFSGFFVNFDTIPGYLQWVTYVSYVRYAFEGIYKNK